MIGLNSPDKLQSWYDDNVSEQNNYELSEVHYGIEEYNYLYINLVMASSYGICTTGTKRKTEKIDLYFEDKIKDTKDIKITLFSWTRIDQLKKKLTKDKYNNHLAWNDIRLFYKNIQLTPDNRRFFDFGV